MGPRMGISRAEFTRRLEDVAGRSLSNPEKRIVDDLLVVRRNGVVANLKRAMGITDLDYVLTLNGEERAQIGLLTRVVSATEPTPQQIQIANGVLLRIRQHYV